MNFLSLLSSVFGRQSRLWIFIFVYLIWNFPYAIAATELKDPYKEIISQKAKAAEEQEDDGLFTGITIKDGNTTIRQGELIGIDSAGLRGSDGKIPREVLPYLTRSVVYVSSGEGNVSYSESRSSSSVGISPSGIGFSSNSKTTDTETTIPSGVTVSKKVNRTT